MGTMLRAMTQHAMLQTTSKSVAILLSPWYATLTHYKLKSWQLVIKINLQSDFWPEVVEVILTCKEQSFLFDIIHGLYKDCPCIIQQLRVFF